MLAGLLAAIPLLGPLFGMVASIFTKYKDVELGKYQTDGSVVTESIKASAETTIAFKDEFGVRFCRDMLMLPGSAWCGLYLWDKIVAHRYPSLVFDVAPLDGSLVILPTALLTFFFGLSAMNIWKRS